MRTSFSFLLPMMFALFGSSSSPFEATVSGKPRFEVIAYYSGNGQDLHRYNFDQLTQVIYSFCHLKGQELAVDNAADSIAIRNLVALKKQHPQLKVLLSLGGWCGCKSCSEVFAGDAGRKAFAQSVLKLMKTYQTDGLDLDWEYPAIEGCPGHPFDLSDRQNFTALVRELRRVLGRRYELSFAAGGFDTFIEQSIEWDKVMPLLNRVNLMSYDLVSGFSTRTGHHTPLYGTPQQAVSVDSGVKKLIQMGVPRRKIVIGAAFYARVWAEVENLDSGIYQSGKFVDFVHFKHFNKRLSAENDFVFYRDNIAQAPYAYSVKRKEFATFDDATSIALKTNYALQEKLGGIMFWEITSDSDNGALLNAIHEAVKKW